MKRSIIASITMLSLAIVIGMSACERAEEMPLATIPETTANLTASPATLPAPDENERRTGATMVNITVGDRVFSAVFHDNDSAHALVDQMPFALDMDDYAGQEKVAGVPYNLPSASTLTPATIHTGDLYLWSGNSLVLFYTTFANSYSYVPVGYIADTAGLIEALGAGSATVTFSVAQ